MGTMYDAIDTIEGVKIVETVAHADAAPPGSTALQHVDALIALYEAQAPGGVTEIQQVLSNLLKLRCAIAEDCP